MNLTSIKVLAALCMPVLLASAGSRAAVIGTMAGSSPDEGAPATSVAIHPFDMALSPAGQVHFIDRASHRIRKLVNGTLVTVAGNGSAGFGGDGGPANQASFSFARGIVFDSRGNLYISDHDSRRIRRVDTAGIITTIAGTGVGGPIVNGVPAITAQIERPSALAYDASTDTLFFRDRENDVVRKITLTDGILNTLPISANYMVSNGAGGLFTTDGLEIFSVTAAGVQTTFAGSAPGGLGIGDGGPLATATFNGIRGLFRTSNGDLFISENGSTVSGNEQGNRVRRITAAGVLSTVAGESVNFINSNPGFSGDGGPATGAKLRKPRGVVVDTAGTVYVADHGNHRIRAFTAGGNINTVAGNGFYSGDGNGGQALTATLNNPRSIAADANGNTYVAEAENHRVRRIAPNGTISVFAGTGFPGLDGDGPATERKLNTPRAVAVDAAGNVYIADSKNFLLRKVDTTGRLSTIAGTGVQGNTGNSGLATAAQVDDIHAIAVNGSMIVFAQKDGDIRSIDGAGIITLVPGVSADLGKGGIGTGLAFDASGNLFVANTIGDIRKRTPLGVVTTYVNTGLDQSTGVACDAAGNVYCADRRNHRVVRVDTSQVVTTFAGVMGQAGFNGDGGDPLTSKLSFPQAVAIDRNGALLIADTGAHRIRKVRASNTPPVITSATASQSGAFANTPVSFTATATDADGDPVAFMWDFGDGFSSGGSTVSHAFATEADLTVTVRATDGFSMVQARLPFSAFSDSSGGTGIKNIGENKPAVVNQLNGISMRIVRSSGGVVELLINVDALNRDAFDISTDFDGIANRVGTRSGARPVQKFTKPGVFVATTTASDSVTKAARGKARLQFTMSKRELGQPVKVKKDPVSNGITASSVKGTFNFGRNANSGAGAATQGKRDTVSYSGKIELPEGLALNEDQEVVVGIGNIVDSVIVNAKGAAQMPSAGGRLKNLKIKYPRLEKGSTETTSGQTATITFTMSSENMSANGFDTEGVAAQVRADEAGKKSVPRQIQVSMVIGGIPYESSVKAAFALSKNADAGKISGRAEK